MLATPIYRTILGFKVQSDRRQAAPPNYHTHHHSDRRRRPGKEGGRRIKGPQLMASV